MATRRLLFSECSLRPATTGWTDFSGEGTDGPYTGMYIKEDADGPFRYSPGDGCRNGNMELFYIGAATEYSFASQTEPTQLRQSDSDLVPFIANLDEYDGDKLFVQTLIDTLVFDTAGAREAVESVTRNCESVHITSRVAG